MPSASQSAPSARPVPRVIADAGRPYVIVEYVGGNLGNFQVRGLGRLSHSFSAKESGRRRWVLSDDAEKICAHPDFVMHSETRVDPEANRQRALIEEAVAAMVGKAEDHRPTPRETSPARGGRPRIPNDLNLLCVHLARHCQQAWTPEALAAEYIENDLSDPAEAMRTRMRRFWKSHPPVAAGEPEQCRYRAKHYCPEPPDPPPDTRQPSDKTSRCRFVVSFSGSSGMLHVSATRREVAGCGMPLWGRR